MKATAKVREWGSSLGLVVPSEAVKKEGLKPGDEVTIEIKKSRSLKELFGIARHLKLDAQAIKDELRREEAASDAKLSALLEKSRQERKKK